MRRLSIPGFTPPPVRAPTEPIFIPSSSSKKEKPSHNSEERVGNSSGTRDEIMRELESLRAQIAANQRLDLAGGVRYSSGVTWNEIEEPMYDRSYLSGTSYGNLTTLPPIRRSYAGLSGLGGLNLLALQSAQARREMEEMEDRMVYESLQVRSGRWSW